MNKLFNSNKVIWNGENYIPSLENDSDDENELPNTTNEEESDEDEDEDFCGYDEN
jgi:hypothetical protein